MRTRVSNRRRFLEVGLAALISTPGRTMLGQTPVRRSIKVEAKVTIDAAVLLAISPDGQYLCIRTTNQPIERFLVRGRRVARLAPDRQGDSLQVINTGTGEAILTQEFGARILPASFFDDGRRLHARVDRVEAGKGASLNVVVDLSTGAIAERTSPLFPSFMAADGSTLIAIHNLETNQKGLIRVELPDYRETQRVPLEVPSGKHWTRVSSDLLVTADRRMLLYTLDSHEVICRRVNNFDVLWSKTIDPREFPAGITALAVSPNGSRVAVSMAENRNIRQRGQLGIAILDARSGRELARLPIDGYGQMGISEDGELLAVGSTPIDPVTSETVSTVSVYEVRSGSRLAALEHDRLRVQRSGDSLGVGFVVEGIQFSPDGRYLITGGVTRTRIWSIDRP